MKKNIKNIAFSITLLTCAYASMAEASAPRGPKVRHEYLEHRDQIKPELIDQLVGYMLEAEVNRIPKRSGTGEMELIDAQALLAASYEEKAEVIRHMPREMREAVFNKLAEQLMRGPKKPFVVPTNITCFSQLDTFLALSEILCDDSEGVYTSLRDAIIDCLGENKILELKNKLGKPHIKSLLPSDFKREFLTSDPMKWPALIMRLNPLMETKKK